MEENGHWADKSRLLRQKRKTLALRVLEDGTLEIRAPLSLPQKEIDRFVFQKAEWISKQREKNRERAEQKNAFLNQRSTQCLLLGTQYPVERQRGEKAFFDKTRFCLPENITGEQERELLTEIYRKSARTILEQRVSFWSEKTGFYPVRMRITGASTRWGSCSGKNSINFSWKLIMAPPPAVDYVVIHELCHLKEKNHGPAFWSLVERFCPDWKEKQALLRPLEKILAGEAW